MKQGSLSEGRARLPILLLAILGLLAAIWAGLLRMGWNWPLLWPTLPMAHGPLMVGGFLGTVIGISPCHFPWFRHHDGLCPCADCLSGTPKG